MKELTNELLKKIKISFVVIFTSMKNPPFKSRFVSSPLIFSTEKLLRGHKKSALLAANFILVL